jgi:hypothetical protein
MSKRRELLAGLCERHEIISLYGYGSRSKEALAWLSGEVETLARGGSDLDLAAVLAGSCRLEAEKRVEVIIELEDFFRIERVDLLLLREAGVFLAADAIRGELLYCDDEDRQAEEELLCLRRAADLAPFEIRRQEAMLNGELLR